MIYQVGEEPLLIAPPRSPLRVLAALWGAIRLFYSHFTIFLLYGLAIILTIPLVFPSPVLMLSLYRVAKRAYIGPTAPDKEMIKETLQDNFPWSVLLFLLNLAVAVMLLLAANFYYRITGIFMFLTVGVAVFLLWTGVAFYTFPIAVVRKSHGLRDIFRWASIFTFGRPLATLIVLLILGGLAYLTLYMPALLFLLPPLLASWGTLLTSPPPPPLKDLPEFEPKKEAK